MPGLLKPPKSRASIHDHKAPIRQDSLQYYTMSEMMCSNRQRARSVLTPIYVPGALVQSSHSTDPRVHAEPSSPVTTEPWRRHSELVVLAPCLSYKRKASGSSIALFHYHFDCNICHLSTCAHSTHSHQPLPKPTSIHASLACRKFRWG
jgi:hypothetical protein